MYELANSFRHGWGVEKDAVAARSYYETAANLGDSDAMNEVARMYEAGEGGKKDKVSPSVYFSNGPNQKFLVLCVGGCRDDLYSALPLISYYLPPIWHA